MLLRKQIITMLKFRRKLLAALLAASIALSSGVVWSEEAGDDENLDSEMTAGNEEGEAEDEAADGEGAGEAEDAPVTQDEALAAMKVYAENDNLKLYVNEGTCIFAVENKKSGYIWWSTPYDYESDPIAAGVQKNLMASTLSYRPYDVTNGTLANTTSFSYESSVLKKTFQMDAIDNGVKFTFTFGGPGSIGGHNFVIPVSIILEDNSFTAVVHTDEIDEQYGTVEDDLIYELITMNLLQSMGAGRADEDGYLFVPDGSGAVIRFNNGKTSTQVYQSQVYGRDLAISQDKAGVKTEKTYLPVLGIVKEHEDGDDALLAVVTAGDAYAYVNASVNGQATTSINSAWFSFEFRATDTYTIGTKTPLTVFQSGDVRVDEIAVRYYVMSGDEVNIADLADTYRNYLIDEKGLTKQSMEDSSDLYVTVMGGTVKKQSVLGFPVDMQTVATSYEEALEIVQKLKELGVDGITLTYNDFNDSGVTGKISDGVNYSNKLGGKDAFNQLYGYIKNNGFTLYPEVDIMEYVRSGYGYSFTLNSSKRITNAYATQTAFELAFGTPDTEVKPHWTILSPYYWPDLFRKVTESFTKEGIDTISLNQATSVLYSDFGRRNSQGEEHILRNDAMNMLVDGYKQLTGAGISMIAQECNAYALPYVSAITNVPMYSSNYDLFDYDVPFYQMVIHGYIPYSSKPANASSNKEELLLLSMLTGAGVHYEFMYHSPNDFTDSMYDAYFYANYEGWLKFAAEDYKLFNSVSNLSDKTITKYERNADKNYTATYSDGTVITVDTDAFTYTINGKESSLADNELKGEES